MTPRSNKWGAEKALGSGGVDSGGRRGGGIQWPFICRERCFHAECWNLRPHAFRSAVAQREGLSVTRRRKLIGTDNATHKYSSPLITAN